MRGLAYFYFPQSNGRPREHHRVGDMRRGRIDANELRREALAAGKLIDLPGTITIHHRGEGVERADAVRIIPMPCRVAGWRWLLLCPRCHAKRVHLFHVRSGVACRACLGLVYGRTTQ